MSLLKPNKPQCFSGERHEFKVRAWLYQVKQYITLAQVGSTTNIDDSTKISLASTFLSGTAATWWYTIIASNQAPTTWKDFEQLVLQEFVPFDSVQRSRDKLKRLVQRKSVSSYLSEFRNIALMVPDMTEGEKVDRFCQGLQPQIRLEVMKAGARTMEQASRIALNVDSALSGLGYSWNQGNGNRSVPTPMEIGNFQRNNHMQSQREQNLLRGACFTCHKVGCRPSMHRKGKNGNRSKFRKKDANVGNMNAGQSDAGPSSEN